MYEKKQKGFYSLNYYDLLYYIKLTINDNNKFENETRLYNTTSLSSIESNFYSLNLLKNNDDNFVSITIFNGGAEFVEYGYASCINSHDSIFIGEKIKISFSIKSLFKINDDIFFINKNSQTIHSIIDRYSKPINYSTKYNKNYIKYNYSEFYDYIKNNKIKLFFTNSLNEKKSQICEYALNFYKCKKDCEFNIFSH